MKRTLLGGLVLAVSLFFGQVGISHAAPAVQDVSYDTFCDGATVTYDMFTGIASGVQTGCGGSAFGNMVGTVARVFNQGIAVTLGYDSAAAFAPFGVVTVIRADNTWTHYGNAAGTVTVVNSGTWSPALALAPNAAGGPSLGN